MPSFHSKRRHHRVCATPPTELCEPMCMKKALDLAHLSVSEPWSSTKNGGCIETCTEGNKMYEVDETTIPEKHKAVDLCTEGESADVMGAMKELEKMPLAAKSLRFIDELGIADVAEVVEVEDLADLNRWLPGEKEEAAKAWPKILLAELDAAAMLDTAARRAALSRLEGSVLHLAQGPDWGIVERAFRLARCDEELDAILSELKGHVMEMAASPNGSQVLSACIQWLHPFHVSFVVEEFAGIACLMARTKCADQVLYRMLKCLPFQQTEPLLAELCRGASRLSTCPRGSRVLHFALSIYSCVGAYFPPDHVARVNIPTAGFSLPMVGEHVPR
eukprot:TRINITY_DN64087_c0_g1_i1.p1 TRINITY_DN64087_c0_g1~~TRINITY_DN64087_c0_g1_i1.p1  ORF type:complete len:333 (-),score=56.97 TRINITY_DN64087_c0_g1_i1:35-1033(-)